MSTVGTFVTGHSVLRYGQIYTLVSGANHIQYNTIQIVRAYTRDLTMAAVGQASGLARSATGIILI